MNNIKKISINNIDNIPNIPIYYIEELNQYAIKINGILYRGNIGNIYSKISINCIKNQDLKETGGDDDSSNIKKKKTIKQIVTCKYKNKCYNLLHISKICNFYHDIKDLYELLQNNIISIEKYNLYKNTYKNFIDTNWIYTNKNKNDKNKNVRHFGSYENLLYDMQILQIDKVNQTNNSKNIPEIENFKSQLIHDILIGNELSKNNLLI